jgi:hypothetical protein
VIGWPPSLPAGYEHREVEGVGLAGLAPLLASLVAALRRDSLYGYARRHPGRRAMQGRAPAYAVPLPGGERVVIRHVRHGGVLAPLTGDRFFIPTRAAHELRTAIRLQAAGVPTAEVVGFAVYPAGPLLRRVDVVTRELPGRDLAELLSSERDPAMRERALRATAILLQRLAEAGAWHPDLNLKNVHIGAHGEGLVAAVLDVDRVHFRARDVMRRNVQRLARSALRWRQHGTPISDEELRRIEHLGDLRDGP